MRPPAQPVTLPHDAIRDLPRSADSEQGVHSGYYPGGVFEYAKTFDVPEEWRDKTVVLEFEGVYRDAVVFVNGDFVVHEPNGYNAFSAVLDPFLRYGEPNRDHRRGEGAQGQPMVFRRGHLSPGASAGRRSGALRARWTASHDARHRRRARGGVDRIDGRQRHAPHGDRAHRVVDRRPRRRRGRGDLGTGDDPSGASSATARVRLVVPAPALWHPDHPALYEVRVTVLHDDRATRSTRMPRPSASVACSWIRSRVCGSTARR